MLYRAFILNAANNFVGVRVLDCTNDKHAIAQAEILALLHPLQLWQGNRLVSNLAQTESTPIVSTAIPVA
jgi:hypothetical protein